MKRRIKNLADTPLAGVLWVISEVIVFFEYLFFKISWFLEGNRKPEQEAVKMMRENVTFIFKSFERQKLAKQLYKNIQSYYPGVKVIIADDSKKPLKIKGEYVEIIQLPFNSGLSFGLNRALEQVKTPFVVRMDDDEKITPFSCFHKQLQFLMEHKEVDLVGVLPWNLPCNTSLTVIREEYYKHSMQEAPKRLLIPHMTKIDETHIVVGKTANIFIARTEKIRAVGYDDNIRMLDHHEFFFRAAGNLVSVLDTECYVFHYHNQFDREYRKYRTDMQGDMTYIRAKWAGKNKQRSIRPLFMEALGAALQGQMVDWEKLSPQEWNKLFELAEQQQVLSLIYDAVCESPAAKLEPKLFAMYQQKVYQEVAIQTVKTNEFLRVYQTLQDAGVTALLVKGMICRALYPKPSYRISVDEDIWIPKEQFLQTHNALVKAGMKLKDPEKDMHLEYEVAYVKKGSYLYVELHKDLFPEFEDAYSEYNQFFEQAFDRTVTQIFQQTIVSTMGHTDHLLYLICHAFKHFLHSGVGVRQVCDVVLYSNAYRDTIDWEYIYQCCRQIQADGVVAAMYRIGERFFHCPSCWYETDVDERALLNDMLTGGVLGNVGTERMRSSNMTLGAVTNQKDGKTNHGTVVNMVFPPMKNMIGRAPYLNNYPWLLPWAWIVRLIKYRASEQSAKKSIDIGNQRLQMMKQYGVLRED